MKDKKQHKWRNQLLLFILFPFLIVLLPCILIAYLVTKILIYLSVWVFWSTRGIRLLYVYSNSPNWQEHIEKEVLPRLPEGKIVINWSERTRWKRLGLPSIVFHHFGGSREFNPMAVIVRPFQRAQVFRFYQAFKDFKHGKEEPLSKLESEFFEALET